RDNGLVDELGTLDDAVAAAKQMAGLAADDDGELLLLPKPRTLLDTLLDLKSDTRAPALGARQLLREFPEVGGKVGPVGGVLRLRGEPVWLVLPYRLDVGQRARRLRLRAHREAGRGPGWAEDKARAGLPVRGVRPARWREHGVRSVPALRPGRGAAGAAAPAARAPRPLQPGPGAVHRRCGV